MTATAAVANAANELRVANGRYAAGRSKPLTRWDHANHPEGLGGQFISQAGPAVALGKRCGCARSSSSVVIEGRCCSTIFDDNLCSS